MHYLIKVTNNGAATTSSSKLRIADTLPDGLQFFAGSATGIDDAGAAVSWNCIGAGQSVVCTTTTTVSTGSSIKLLFSASVNSATSGASTNKVTATGGGTDVEAIAASTTTPAAASCDALITNGFYNLSEHPDIDQMDLAAALKSTSLFQQVVDQRVGSFAIDNYLRALLLETAAAAFVNKVNSVTAANTTQAATEGAVTFGDLSSVFAKCRPGSASPLDCISTLDGIEQKVATTHNHEAACAFARYTWMPTFTAIKLASQNGTGPEPGSKASPWPLNAPAALDGHQTPTGDQAAAASFIERKDFGAAPGC